jgi:ABC-type xylose transport system permease subunit
MQLGKLLQQQLQLQLLPQQNATPTQREQKEQREQREQRAASQALLLIIGLLILNVELRLQTQMQYLRTYNLLSLMIP